MKRRKPTIGERVSGCAAFLKLLIINFFRCNSDKMKFYWTLFKLTAAGKFEVEENE